MPFGLWPYKLQARQTIQGLRDMGICPDYILLDTLTLFFARGKIMPANRRFSSLYKTKALYEGRLKVILQRQVSSHYFEPTFIILFLICRTLPDQPK